MLAVARMPAVMVAMEVHCLGLQHIRRYGQRGDSEEEHSSPKLGSGVFIFYKLPFQLGLGTWFGSP